jgi:hypothetical protein
VTVDAVALREVLPDAGERAGVGLLEQPPLGLRRVVVPVRIVEVRKRKNGPVAHAVEDLDGAVRHLGARGPERKSRLSKPSSRPYTAET